ncbi:MAG: signal peptide peptidase SppA [Novosphingobium sp.]|nr:signal peptide peptidase SppA [Novosphingobium sp.]
MEFARKVWKVLVAVKDGLALLLLLMFFGLLYAALSARPGPAAVEKGALLLKLDGFVVEEPSIVDPITLLMSPEAPLGEQRARDVVRALRTAAKDDRIKLVALDLSGFLGGGQVHMEEIADALDLVRKSGKKVYAFGLAYFDDGLLLAAHADEVWVDPQGGAFISGPGGSHLYYAGLLEKLKVKVNVFRVGTYKSAVEPYILNGPSEPSRRASEALYGTMWDHWQAEYRKARPKVDLDLVANRPAEWLEALQGNSALAAKSAGIVDRIGTISDFNLHLQELAGEDPRDDSFGAYARTDMKTWLAANPEEKPGKAIGVVTIAGELVDGEAGPGVAGSERIVGVLEDAYDDDLAALVVRVDSPGGSLLASEHVRRAVQRFKDKGIPVVVSMANLAASGGYWVSTPASRIFAEPSTITGSIGVFAVIPTFGEALDSIGVKSEGIKTTPLTGEPDVIGGFSPEMQTILQSRVENNYREFVSLVAKSRKISADNAPDWAEGRPWDGGTARQLGLVDQFGGLDDALAFAAKQAGLADGKWHAEYLGQQPANSVAAILSRLAGSEGRQGAAGDFVSALAMRQDRLLDQVEAALRGLVETRGVQALCVECPAVGTQPVSRSTPRESSLILSLLKAMAS